MGKKTAIDVNLMEKILEKFASNISQEEEKLQSFLKEYQVNYTPSNTPKDWEEKVKTWVLMAQKENRR